MALDLIFPVAGEGSRFGGTFKPFLNIGDITFIETTLKPFRDYLSFIDKIYFICTLEQEEKYDVKSSFKYVFPDLSDLIEVVIIDHKTQGPYQTIREGIKKANISGPSIVCDCDHSLDVDGIFNLALKGEVDAAIPIWDIDKCDWMNWSKVVLDSNEVKMICEKERISSDDYEVKGIIGCVYFKNIKENFKSTEHIYVSDCLQQLLKENKAINVVDVEWASFYGDEKMLEQHVNNLRKKCSVFCDIDGVLIKHHPHSNCELDLNKTIDGFDKLEHWKKAGHRVVLTTARNEKYRSRTESLLKDLGIKYDHLVMSLPAGPRLLINDHKPSKQFVNQAKAVELPRDFGISKLDILNYYKESDTVIKKVFDGGSFAKTYLLDNNIVRKHIIKSEDNFLHYEKLKRQVDDLKRFYFLWTGSTPKILKQSDTDFDFSFDMEYLDGHVTVADLQDKDLQKKAIETLLSGMDRNVYRLKKETDGISWLQNHYDNKIFSKFDSYSEDEDLKKIIWSDYIRINGKVYSGLAKTLSKIDKHIVKPNFIRPIHGDFTLENVMCDKQGENIKLIDMDGSDIFDAAELDLGKMCQSIFSKFDEWKNSDPKVSYNNYGNFDCTDKYFDVNITDNFLSGILDQWATILNDDKATVVKKGVFYMCMYFIRFVPFRMKISKDHGIFALLMAIVWLTKIK